MFALKIITIIYVSVMILCHFIEMVKNAIHEEVLISIIALMLIGFSITALVYICMT